MTSEVIIIQAISDELNMAIIRLNEPRVMISFELSKSSIRKFDQYRMPVIWIDGILAIDFCDIKSLHDFQNSIDPMHVSFSKNDDYISGVVWHGVKKEGTGVIGKINESSEVKIRFYFADYDIEDYVISGEELGNIKKETLEKLL
ncbi:hypothetical protein [uncultured Methylobacterium sp.]|jgi:hypothetical protein|uniref:hypothetical protein n=1 Tax=uncultured Methylobacterium sp. TaxID=157278 RepID=UPI002619E6C3|nr:hypothetical protein [uncultured Methylobacterium sp.]